MWLALVRISYKLQSNDEEMAAHAHPLRLIQTGAWTCNGCRNAFAEPKSPRFRCVLESCDFDYCPRCIATSRTNVMHVGHTHTLAKVGDRALAVLALYLNCICNRAMTCALGSAIFAVPTLALRGASPSCGTDASRDATTTVRESADSYQCSLILWISLVCAFCMCADVARKWPHHEHRIASVNSNSAWYCNLCRGSHPSMDKSVRLRCTDSCDWDACLDCIKRPLSTQRPPATRTVTPPPLPKPIPPARAAPPAPFEFPPMPPPPSYPAAAAPVLGLPMDPPPFSPPSYGSGAGYPLMGPAPTGPSAPPAAPQPQARPAPQSTSYPVPVAVPVPVPMSFSSTQSSVSSLSDSSTSAKKPANKTIQEFLAVIELSQYEVALSDDGVDDTETLTQYTLEMLKGLGIKQGHAIKMLDKARSQ